MRQTIVLSAAERSAIAARKARLARMHDAAKHKAIQGPVEAAIMLGMLASYGEYCTAPAIASTLGMASETVRYRLDKIRLRLIREEHPVRIDSCEGCWFIPPTYPQDLDDMFDRCLRIIARDRADVIADEVSGAFLIRPRLSATPSTMIGRGA